MRPSARQPNDTQHQVLNFYIMFNFIIAIIVESYMHVQNEVRSLQTCSCPIPAAEQAASSPLSFT